MSLLKFHPPSLRPEVPIGQAPPVLPLTGDPLGQGGRQPSDENRAGG